MQWFKNMAGNIALRISLGYLLLAVSWILLSDRVLEWLAPSPELGSKIQGIKGVTFVILTAWMLYHLINRYQVLALRYNSLSRYANDIILLLDNRGFIIDVNDKGEAMYGYKRDTLIGKHANFLFHQQIEDWDGEYRKHKQQLREHGLIYQSTHKRANGQSFPVEVSAAFIEIGKHQLIQAIIRDLSERHTAEIERRQREDLLGEMSKIAHVGGWQFDCQSKRATWTAEVARIHEVDASYVPIEYALSFYHGDSRNKIEAALQAGMQDGTPYDLELEMVTATGRHKWVRTVGRPRIENGTVVQIYGSLQDITGQKQAEEKMLLATLVFENSSEAIFIADADNNILSVNPAFTELTGFTFEEVIGSNPRVLTSGLHSESFYEEMWQRLESEGRWQGEIWNRKKNGEVYAEWLSINTIFDGKGEVLRRVALFSDITESKQNQELIWRQANFDNLTGLPNRRMLHDRLDQEIKKTGRTHQLMAILFIDLDRFKEVNDSFGHMVGDVLLKEAASRLVNCVRETDTVARLGGDEFVVILPALSEIDGLQRTANSILRQFDQPFMLGKETVHISASIGITLFPNDADNVDDLLKNADQAMYFAKNNGRNRYYYFTPSMQEATQKRMRLTNDLYGALAADQFTLHYQPIVELSNHQVVKAEALIRWQHPERGLVSPNDFIPIAEDTGMIVAIGDWVFQQAAMQVKRLQTQHHPNFQISINKSPVQFRNEDSSHSDWLEFLRTHDMPKQSIVIEITEGLLIETQSSVTDQLLSFRDAGVQVALDDFGTGYSSLAYLKKFDIDYIKIDRAFVRNLETSASDNALCEAIIVMAHKLGIKVIAEGIETQAQFDFLLRMGCDYGQGYLFSPPMPAEKFEAYLADYRTKRA